MKVTASDSGGLFVFMKKVRAVVLVRDGMINMGKVDNLAVWVDWKHSGWVGMEMTWVQLMSNRGEGAEKIMNDVGWSDSWRVSVYSL